MITNGKFGKYGGTFVPELIIPALEELEAAFLKYKDDEKFVNELDYYLKNLLEDQHHFTLRKTLSEQFGCKVYLKREDMLHTGAHKINNTLGQGLLSKIYG